MSELDIRDLSVTYGSGADTPSVDGVSLQVRSGSVMGLVGESGSGKSSLARAVLGMAPVTSGRVLLDGVELAPTPRGRRRLDQRVQMIFQDAQGSLDPRMRIGESIGEALRERGLKGAARDREVLAWLENVGLDPRLAQVRPKNLSGGQSQRVAIARALAAEPTLLVADEITSALDVSIQGAILNLVRARQRELGFTLLFISHNLATVRYLADTAGVMYAGQMVESGTAEEITRCPAHPYSRALLESVPNLRPPGQEIPRTDATDLVEDTGAIELGPGCRYQPRCPVGPRAHPDREVCRESDPRRSDDGEDGHEVACFFPFERVTGP